MTWRWGQPPGCRLFAQAVASAPIGDSYTFPIDGQEDLFHPDHYTEHPANPHIQRVVTHTVAGVLHGSAEVSYPSFEPYIYESRRGLGWNPYSPTLMGGPREPCTVTAASEHFVWWCLVPRVPDWRLGFEVVNPGHAQRLPEVDEVYIIPLDVPVGVEAFELDVYEIGKRVTSKGRVLTIDGQPDARVALVWHNRA